MRNILSHLNLMFNVFAVFGTLFLVVVSIGANIFDVHQYKFNGLLLLIVGVVLYGLIYFLSFVYLKSMMVGKNYNAAIIKRYILLFMFLYYLKNFLNPMFGDFDGLRTVWGFTTPLWMLSPLIVEKALDRKTLYIVYGLVITETIYFSIFCYYTDAIEISLYATTLSVLVLLFFPLFLRFLNNIEFKFTFQTHLGDLGRFITHILFILGIFMFLSYYWLF